MFLHELVALAILWNHSTLQSVHMVHNLRIAGTRKVLCTVFLFVSIWRSLYHLLRPIRIKVDAENLPVVIIGVLVLCPSKDPDGWDNIVHRLNAFEVEFGWVHFESMLAVKPALWQMFGTGLAVGRAKGPTTLSKYGELWNQVLPRFLQSCYTD